MDPMIGFQEVVSVAFFRKKLGLRNFVTHRGGIIFFGPFPPTLGWEEKIVIPRFFLRPPPPPPPAAVLLFQGFVL